MDKETAIKIMDKKTSCETIKKLEKELNLSYEESVNIIQEALDIGIDAIKKTTIKNCEGCHYKKYCQVKDVVNLDYCSNYITFENYIKE